jgi:hypothetical protein
MLKSPVCNTQEQIQLSTQSLRQRVTETDTHTHASLLSLTCALAHIESPLTHSNLTCSQVVSVLREGDGGDRADVAGEVGHIGALLQVPDLDLRVGRPRPEDQTVRVELGTGQSWRGTRQDV